MFFTPFQQAHKLAHADEKSSLPIPMIYEQVPVQQLKWEYHLLSIDPKEVEFASIEQLNALGREGWVLVSILDERAIGNGSTVHYYFVRQDLNA